MSAADRQEARSAAACTCGQRDAERYPDATDRVIVPSAADCPTHGVSAATERRCSLCGDSITGAVCAARITDEDLVILLCEDCDADE